MHRRVAHHPTSGSATTNTNGQGQQGATPGSPRAAHASTLHHSAKVSPLDTAPSASSFPKRRKKRRVKYGVSRRGRKMGLGFFGDDDRIQCMMILAGILIVFIGTGLYIVWHLVMNSNRSIRNMIFPQSVHFSSNEETEEAHGHRIPRRRTRNPNEEFPILDPSPVYTVPLSMAHLGDRSDEYAILRKEFDHAHPFDPERSLRVTEALRKHPHLETVESAPSYDIYDCPDEPPVGYPHEWKTLEILNHWKPHDTDIPSQIYQGLCVFDYAKDYVKALRYQKAGLPFVTRGDPAVAAAVERWNSPTYMEEMLGIVPHRTEYSENNHFMYWRPDKNKKKKKKKKTMLDRDEEKKANDWKPPTKMMRMTYNEWLKHANVTDESQLGPDKPHWYFRLIGCGLTGPDGSCDAGSSEYLFDELTFFQPRPHQLYLVEPHEQNGIHCRFGMEGVIAENHFDASRNAIVVLGGERRYILSHPKNCPNLALLPKDHPSARHSAVNWNDPDLEEYPEFANAMSNEVVLQAGDVLFLPTTWFHFIVSLSLNFQCNTRSGQEEEYLKSLQSCGF